MSVPTHPTSISVIVPTIGRPDSLRRLLESLAAQTCRVREIIVADGSEGDGISAVTIDPTWAAAGLLLRRLIVTPPNAVRQRQAAIREATGDLLLLLDDDVVLEPDCVKQMLKLLESDLGVVAVMADFNNQLWPMPTRAWHFYLRYLVGLKEDAWQGRVVGPLLRFGYNPVPATPQPMEWLGAGNSLIRRVAYEQCGGFSDFFLHRCTMNEDVDLGLKLGRVGKILFSPAARMAHNHAPGGRVSIMQAAEDDMYNRYCVMRFTLNRTKSSAMWQILVYFLIETLSSFAGCIKRRGIRGFPSRTWGRIRAMFRILGSKSSNEAV
jgi:GT2 family glycosyltransferase